MASCLPATHQNGHSEAPFKPLNHFLSSLPTTVFEVMTRLAVQHKAINLGQGFPDDEGPESMKQAVGKAVLEQSNQYPPMLGTPELRQAVARHSKQWQGIEVDWQTEALVTVGATEALAAAFLGLLNPGDEVIFFDPMYDSYVSMADRSGAVVVSVKLSLPDWSVPREELAAAFSDRTKLILINTPHNPTGRVFSQEDLAFIAALCRQHGAYAVLDEVYEHLVYGGHPHTSLRALPGMRDRCIRIGSAGKTFSFTAWKVGWVTGPSPLIAAVAKAHQFVTFTVASCLQQAVAYGLDNESSYYCGLGEELHRKRQYLERRLAKIGFAVLPGQGTYFLIADIRPLLLPGSAETDVNFCQRLTVEAGVTLIPVSAFYNSKDPPRHLVRFCFCKKDEKLQRACDALQAYFKPLSRLL